MDGNKLLREVAALACTSVAALMVVSLATHHRLDPSINQAVSDGYVIHNSAGLVGAFVSGLLVDLFGFAAFLWPLLFLYWAARLITRRVQFSWYRWVGISLLAVTLLTWSASQWGRPLFAFGHVAGGGFFGGLLYDTSMEYLRPLGAAVFWLFIFFSGVQITLGIVWTSVLKRFFGSATDVWLKFYERWQRHRLISAEKREEKRREREKRLEEARIQAELEAKEQAEVEAKEPAAHKATSATRTTSAVPAPEADSDDFAFEATPSAASQPASKDSNELQIPLVSSSAGKTQKSSSNTSTPQPSARPSKPKATPAGACALPQTELLAVNPGDEQGEDMAALKAMADHLVESLVEFGVKGEVTRIVPGPVVTKFEFKPAPGVKISRIAGLSDDIALALKALAVRIEASPGKDTVGIEIPNRERQTVYLRDIFDSKAFTSEKSLLTLAIGKDIQGEPFCADLARMPHLLVAGATGAGKSVCLNAILLSILYKAHPDQVKLLLVDPKRIELSVYGELPHLVHPVVTEMDMAKSALEWAVWDMDQRYQAMARLGVRNIDSYNAKLPGAQKADPALSDLEPMPYLVIIIDELADLMMTAAKEAEMSIVRLAQLARAAGIHLILATQRPSVDVVTGLIKANFPSRISFQVTSKHDSRTILDQVGAERLLGRGDMLYKPSGGALRRMHGAFVSDDEIAHVVDFWKASCPQPDFDIDFASWGDASGTGAIEEGEPGAMDADPLYNDAVEFVTQQGRASISLLQRKFRIGYNKSARIIEQMEADGLLGPQEGSKPRRVLPRETRE